MDPRTAEASGLQASSASAPPSVAVRPAPGTAKHAPAPLPASIEGFDSLINGDVNKFQDLSNSIGGVVAQQV